MELVFDFNVKFKPIFFSKARINDVWGGRGRGGSHFGTDYFLFLITKPDYFRGCFLRAVFGDIKGSLFQDFKDRLAYQLSLPGCELKESDFHINESEKTILYKPTGNTIISKGFKKSSSSSSAKLKSLAGITHVLIEECEEVDLDDFNKLDDSIRTDKIENIQIIRLFNPPSKNHWLIKRWYNLSPALDANGNEIEGWYLATPKSDPDLLSIHTTYLDNIININKKSIAKYQSYSDPESPNYNLEYYYRDVCGLISEGAKGRIYKNWKHITTRFFLDLGLNSFYGLDFGYSEDPVALVEIKRHNKNAYFREIIYEAGLTNGKLAELMAARGVSRSAPIYADSQEAKSIQDLVDLGFNVIPAIKGPDSVMYGIKKLQDLNCHMTEDSTNGWYENEEYKYQLNANKEPTDRPIDKHNHLKDASRYGIVTHEMYGGDAPATGRRN